jgi:hypothetical protein
MRFARDEGEGSNESADKIPSMRSLQEFLAENLVAHKTRVKTLQRLSRGVSHLLLEAKADTRQHWPYSCTVDHDRLNPQYLTNPAPKPQQSTASYKQSFSISTQAMICASIDQILEPGSRSQVSGQR